MLKIQERKLELGADISGENDGKQLKSLLFLQNVI
jgi:hypothetical protein